MLALTRRKKIKEGSIIQVNRGPYYITENLDGTKDKHRLAMRGHFVILKIIISRHKVEIEVLGLDDTGGQFLLLIGCSGRPKRKHGIVWEPYNISKVMTTLPTKNTKPKK